MSLYTQSKAKIAGITIASLLVIAILIWILLSLLGWVFRPRENQQAVVNEPVIEEKLKLVDIKLIDENVDYKIEVERSSDLQIVYEFRDKETDKNLGLEVDVTAYTKNLNITGAVDESDDLQLVPFEDDEELVRENVTKYDFGVYRLGNFRFVRFVEETENAYLYDYNLVDTICSLDNFNQEILEKNQTDRERDYQINASFDIVSDDRIQEYIDIIDNLQCA